MKNTTWTQEGLEQWASALSDKRTQDYKPEGHLAIPVSLQQKLINSLCTQRRTRSKTEMLPLTRAKLESLDSGGRESLPLAAVAFPEAYILQPIPLKWPSRESHDWLSVNAWQVEYLLVYVRSPRKKSQGYMKQKLVKLVVPCVFLIQSLIQSRWVLL